MQDELQQRPSDGEAKSLLDMINRGVPPPPAPTPNAPAVEQCLAGLEPVAHLPMERIKRNYDETSYRQLEMEINNFAEARLAKTDGHTRAAYYVDRGQGVAGA